MMGRTHSLASAENTRQGAIAGPPSRRFGAFTASGSPIDPPHVQRHLELRAQPATIALPPIGQSMQTVMHVDSADLRRRQGFA
jgi:hypothetical protein